VGHSGLDLRVADVRRVQFQAELGDAAGEHERIGARLGVTRLARRGATIENQVHAQQAPGISPLSADAVDAGRVVHRRSAAEHAQGLAGSRAREWRRGTRCSLLVVSQLVEPTRDARA